MKTLNYTDKFIGIWTWASLLHLTEGEILETLKSCHKALKKDGVIYASFKLVECNSEKIIKNRNSHKEILNSSREDILKTVRVFILKNKCFTSTAYKKMNFITFPTLKKN